jgi:hypothetical protein
MELKYHTSDIKLPLATGAIYYNIGQTSIHTGLKPGLSQDVLNLKQKET